MGGSQLQQQTWGTVRFATAAAVLSLLIALPWEKLDHEFSYDRSEVPDSGAQDRPRQGDGPCAPPLLQQQLGLC
jgi:hypothetical protein